jgi:hypothetical protein
MVTGLSFFACWVYSYLLGWPATWVGTAIRPAPLSYVGLEEESWDDTAALVEQMQRLQQAAAAYNRDFRRWPSDPTVLIGRFLPHGFDISSRLTYRPVPDFEQDSYSWILIVSDAVTGNVDGERLITPSRLICRLSGKIELLPAPQAASLLDAQSADFPPAKPSTAATGDSD